MSSTKYDYQQMQGIRIPHHRPCWPATLFIAIMSIRKLRSRQHHVRGQTPTKRPPRKTAIGQLRNKLQNELAAPSKVSVLRTGINSQLVYTKRWNMCKGTGLRTTLLQNDKTS